MKTTLGIGFAALLLTWTATQAETPLTGTLAKIEASGAIVLGYRVDSPPFSSIAAGATTPVGFSIDLCQRVAEKVRERLGLGNIAVKYVPLTPENRFSAVADGLVDLECGNSTITLLRMEKVDFSLMTFITGASLMTLKAKEIPTVDGLKGKTLTVVTGTTTEKALEDKLRELGLSARVIKIADHGAALAMLDKGEADAHVADQLVLIGLARQAADPARYALVAEPFTYEPYGLVLRRNDADFRLVVNRTLARLYRSGEIGQVFERHFGDWGGRPSRLLVAMWAVNGLPE